MAAALSDPEVKDMALSIIANDQASAHLFEESMTTADTIGNAPKRDEVRKSISALQAKTALLNNHPEVKESNE